MKLKNIRFFLSLSIVCLSLDINAQEVIYKNVKINFSEEWKTQENAQKQFMAFSPNKDVLILSLVYPPNIDEGQKTLIAAQDSIDKLEQIIPNVQVVEKEKQIRSSKGMPLQFTQYSYQMKDETRFLIGATIATNAGIALITFDGKGDTNQSLLKFKKIMDHFEFTKPQNGFLFTEKEINKEH
ncbi:hypothetical protein [Acinetobacter beijerinckii]|uniref:DUF1795 domain-containing protein n=1 Tax=Acinetobacter beijerinckii CIP 110307 TaxID=1217648 RepID=N9FE47_9GAMM|nr:hypothetical protein [Acinetobacter beijerinckii]ENW03144.1 hypothetical protein F933_03174 [Acinetobacter beijerinckii CIP 110307]